MSSDRQPVRFGVFEVNLDTGEVRRAGVKVRVQEQPFQVLAALLEKPGEIVTKEELQERIWKDDTFVDFDRSLATAINKARQALGDSATRPRFIETVPKRGYRFVGLGAEPSAAEPPPSGSFFAKPLAWVLLGAAALSVAALVMWSTQGESDSGTLTFSAPRPFTTDIGYEVSPSFSPDGNQIVYAWDGLDQNGFDLYSGLIGSSSRRQLTDTPENEYSPAWSPDGLSIAFARETSPGRLGIYVIPAIGGSERFVGEVASGRLGAGVTTGMLLMNYPTISWMSDGNWILTVDHLSQTDEFEPILISVETGEKRRIGDGVQGRTAAISPSGDKLALVGRDLLSLPLTDSLEPRGQATKLTDFTMALGRPAWTPDGKNLLVTGVPDGESLSVVRLISLDGSAPRRILELGEQVAQQTISPTGRLAFVRRMNDHNIWTVDLPEPTQTGRVNRVIASTYADLNPEFSPDGSKIVFVSSRSGNDEIWISDQDGGNPVQVTHAGEDGVGSPTWSPDGQFIAYDGYAPPQAPIETSRHYLDWEVLIRRADGGGAVRRLTSDGGNVLPAWSPDGKWLYYTNIRSTPPRLYRAAVDGDDVELVAEDVGGAMLPPDGQWVYFGRSGQIWRKPVGGGAEEMMLEERAGPIAVTNEGIYFVAPRSRDDETVIAYRDLGTGTTTEVYRTKKRLYAGMDVSADGHRLIFNLLDQQGSDIMIVDDFWR